MNKLRSPYRSSAARHYIFKIEYTNQVQHPEESSLWYNVCARQIRKLAMTPHNSVTFADYFPPASKSSPHVADLLCFLPPVLSSGPAGDQWSNPSPPVHAPAGFCRYLVELTTGEGKFLYSHWCPSSGPHCCVWGNMFHFVGLTRFQEVLLLVHIHQQLPQRHYLIKHLEQSVSEKES